MRALLSHSTCGAVGYNLLVSLMMIFLVAQTVSLPLRPGQFDPLGLLAAAVIVVLLRSLRGLFMSTTVTLPKWLHRWNRVSDKGLVFTSAICIVAQLLGLVKKIMVRK